MDDKPNVFICDDNHFFINIYVTMIDGLYNTYGFLSARDMLEKLKTMIPDVILMDIVMPDIDGIRAVKILKKDERYKDIPIIFITGIASKTAKQKALKIGAVDYLYKPVIREQLLARIKSVIELHDLENKLKHDREVIYCENQE